MVMREVERKRTVNDVLCNAAVRHSGDSIAQDRQGMMLCDMSSPKWPILLVNEAWQKATGIGQELAIGSHFWDLFDPPPVKQVEAHRLAVEQHRNFELRVPCSMAAIVNKQSLRRDSHASSSNDSVHNGSWNGNPVYLSRSAVGQCVSGSTHCNVHCGSQLNNTVSRLSSITSVR